MHCMIVHLALQRTCDGHTDTNTRRQHVLRYSVASRGNNVHIWIVNVYVEREKLTVELCETASITST